MEEVIGAFVFMETRINLTNKQLALGLEIIA